MSAQQALPLWRRAVQRLDTFHRSEPADGNARAHALVTALVQGREAGPAYLWGEAGSGKTHLLLGACHAATQRGVRAMYLPLGELPLDDDAELFAGLEACALVCVDDVHALAGREALELALFGLHDRVRGAGGAMLLSGEAPPAALGLKRPELASRLGGALGCRLQPPTDAVKLVILTQRATALGLELPEAVGQYLLTRQGRNLGSLISTLEYLDRAALAAQRRLTVPFVRALLDAPA